MSMYGKPSKITYRTPGMSGCSGRESGIPPTFSMACLNEERTRAARPLPTAGGLMSR
jgi:hypothetical protein